jgi:hypothetical protein
MSAAAAMALSKLDRPWYHGVIRTLLRPGQDDYADKQYEWDTGYFLCKASRQRFSRAWIETKSERIIGVDSTPWPKSINERSEVARHQLMCDFSGNQLMDILPCGQLVHSLFHWKLLLGVIVVCFHCWSGVFPICLCNGSLYFSVFAMCWLSAATPLSSMTEPEKQAHENQSAS